MSTKPQCSHEGCKAKAHGSSPLCIFHDPDYQQDIARARARGGQSTAQSKVEIKPPRTVADVATALGDLLPAVAKGKLPDSRCQNIVRMCELLMRALENDYERRLQELEALYAERQTTKDPTN